MNLPLYRGVQDDMITIKCAHADNNFDDPFYPFCVDHVISSIPELENDTSDIAKDVLYVSATLKKLLDEGNDAEIAAFASAGFHFIDKLLGQADGSTFAERLKTLRDGFGDGYFSLVE